MKRLVAILTLTAASAFACSIIPTTYRTDTLSAGTVQIVATYYSYSTTYPLMPTSQSTYGPFTQSDLKTHLAGVLQDSALAFIARIDSLTVDTTGFVAPEIVLASTYPMSGAVNNWVRARLKVDTLIRGTLPGKTFWIRAPQLNSAMCGIGWESFVGRPFLNASVGLVNSASIKLPYGPWGYQNAAYWFDGRYLVAPTFPGLRQDITELYPDYPATGIVTRRAPVVPLRLDGKAYRPDGRIVPESALTGKNPAPILR